MVLTADGQLLATDGLVADSWTYGAAYNLTVDDLHTYFVAVATVRTCWCTTAAIPLQTFSRRGRGQFSAPRSLRGHHRYPKSRT